MPKTLMLCSLSDTTPIIVFYYSTTSGWGQQESCCLPPQNPRCTAQKPSFGVLFQKSFTIFEKSLAFWHRIWYYNLADFGKTEYGRLAQLVEHLLDVQEVTGSSPVPSTTSPDHSVWGFFVVIRQPGTANREFHSIGGILSLAGVVYSA